MDARESGEAEGEVGKALGSGSGSAAEGERLRGGPSLEESEGMGEVGESTRCASSAGVQCSNGFKESSHAKSAEVRAATARRRARETLAQGTVVG